MRAMLWLAATCVLMQAVAAPASQARGEDDDGSGVHSGGYPIGTMSSSQYASRALATNWWGGGSNLGYGSAGYGTGSGLGMGIGGIGFGAYGIGYGGDTNSSYYFSPAQTSMAAPAANDPTDVLEKMANRVPHQEGPSMSFNTSSAASTTDTFAQFNRDWDQIAGPVNYVPVPDSGNVSSNLKLPTISRRLLKTPGAGGTADFVSNVDDFVAQVQSKIVSTEQLLKDYQVSGRLGTFDYQPLQARLDAIKDQFTSTTDPATQTHLLNDLSQLDYDINQHAGN